MNRVRALGLVLVAAFALSAAAASVTSAATLEGPFYKVTGSRLLAGETRLLLASVKPGTTFELISAGIEIKCKALSLPVANEMQLIGSTGANAGKSLEVLHFTECTVEKNGEHCDVENQLILTNLIASLLGYSNSDRTGLVLVLFVPDAGVKDFTTLRFAALPGGECKISALLASIHRSAG